MLFNKLPFSLKAIGIFIWTCKRKGRSQLERRRSWWHSKRLPQKENRHKCDCEELPFYLGKAKKQLKGWGMKESVSLYPSLMDHGINLNSFHLICNTYFFVVQIWPERINGPRLFLPLEKAKHLTWNATSPVKHPVYKGHNRADHGVDLSDQVGQIISYSATPTTIQMNTPPPLVPSRAHPKANWYGHDLSMAQGIQDLALTLTQVE